MSRRSNRHSTTETASTIIIAPTLDPTTIPNSRFVEEYFDPKYKLGNYEPGGPVVDPNQLIAIYDVNAFQNDQLQSRYGLSFELGYLARKHEQVYWLPLKHEDVPQQIFDDILGTPTTVSQLKSCYPTDSLESALHTSAIIMMNNNPTFNTHIASQLNTHQLTALGLPTLFSHNLSLTSLNNSYMIHYSLGIPPPVQLGIPFSSGHYLPVKRSQNELYEIFPPRCLMPIIDKLVQPRLVRQCYEPSQPDPWRQHFRDTILRSNAQQNFLNSNDLMYNITTSSDYRSFWHRCYLFRFMSKMYFRQFNPASHLFRALKRTQKKKRQSDLLEVRKIKDTERYGTSSRITRKSRIEEENNDEDNEDNEDSDKDEDDENYHLTTVSLNPTSKPTKRGSTNPRHDDAIDNSNINSTSKQKNIAKNVNKLGLETKSSSLRSTARKPASITQSANFDVETTKTTQTTSKITKKDTTSSNQSHFNIRTALTRFINSPLDFGIPFARPMNNVNIYNPLNYHFFDYLPKSQQIYNPLDLPPVISPFFLSYQYRSSLLQNLLTNHTVVSQAMETLLLHGFPTDSVGKFNLNRDLYVFAPFSSTTLDVITSFQLGYLQNRSNFNQWSKQFNKLGKTNTPTDTSGSVNKGPKLDQDGFQIPTHTPHLESSWFVNHYPVFQNPSNYGLRWTLLNQLDLSSQRLHQDVELRRLNYYQQQTQYRLELATTYINRFQEYTQNETTLRNTYVRELFHPPKNAETINKWTNANPPPPYIPQPPPDVTSIVAPILHQHYNHQVAEEHILMNRIRNNTTDDAIIPNHASTNISMADIATFTPLAKFFCLFDPTDLTKTTTSASMTNSNTSPLLPRTINYDMIFNLQTLTTPPIASPSSLPSTPTAITIETTINKFKVSTYWFNFQRTLQLTQDIVSRALPYPITDSMIDQYSCGDRSEPTFFWPLTKNTYVYPVRPPAPIEVTKCSCTTGSCLFNPKCANYRSQKECPQNCPRGKNCENNRLRKSNCTKLFERVEIRRTGDRGFGLYLKQPIKRGELLLEYLGEVINTAEMVTRLEEYTNAGSANFYILTIGHDLHVDAARKGNLARFLNHSCDPVCYSERWEVNNQAPREGIFALYDLPAGTELTFDYRMEAPSGSEHLTPVRCLCETDRCSGYLTTRAKPRTTVRELVVRQFSIYVEYICLIFHRIEYFIDLCRQRFDPLTTSSYSSFSSPLSMDDHEHDASSFASNSAMTLHHGDSVVQSLRPSENNNTAYKTRSKQNLAIFEEYHNAVRIVCLLRKVIPRALDWVLNALETEQPMIKRWSTAQQLKLERKKAKKKQ